MTEKYKSGINFRHLLKDQVELYPFSPDEAALVELIANSLDAKCSRISININKDRRIFELIDNGSGMTEKGFKEYHDFAMSFKKRGEGIGFAGLGAKLGLWISEKVETETKSARFNGCSQWFFERDDLFWKKTPKMTLLQNGTRTIFYLKPEQKLLLQDTEVKRIIAKHYHPLFQPFLSQIYALSGIYPKPLEIFVNGKKVDFVEVSAPGEVADREEFWLTAGRKKRFTGIGQFLFMRGELPEEQRGISISTYGKVITRGEWFEKYPSDAQKISGLIEVPYLSRMLTTSKCDFLRYGPEGRKYYRFRREMQKKFGDWLEKLGKIGKKPETPRESAELEKLIRDILGKVPELATIFAALPRQEVAMPAKEGEANAEEVSGAQATGDTEAGGKGEKEEVLLYPGTEETPVLQLKENGPLPATISRRSMPFGPKVGFLEEPRNPKLSKIDANSIIINSGHPAYSKAERNGLKKYHELLAIALALIEEKAPENPAETMELVTKFFSAWGAV